MGGKRVFMTAVATLVLLGICFLPGRLSAQGVSPRPLEVVPTIDLVRYAGVWYEIARLPNRFQKECLSDVTATYALLDDGQILVVNRCRTATGEMTEAEGKARRKAEDEPTSKLLVRFAPAILSCRLCGRTTGSLIWRRTTVTRWSGSLHAGTSGSSRVRPCWPKKRTMPLQDGSDNKDMIPRS
jgi:hypothetical protein